MVGTNIHKTRRNATFLAFVIVVYAHKYKITNNRTIKILIYKTIYRKQNYEAKLSLASFWVSHFAQ